MGIVEKISLALHQMEGRLDRLSLPVGVSSIDIVHKPLSVWGGRR